MKYSNEKPLLSVIIPAYNAEKYVGRAINSVLNQTYNNIQLIVINDGSSDQTENKIKAFGPKIFYFSQENKGVSAARNLGIAKSTGSYVAFLDADDYVSPDTYANMINTACMRNMDIVMCNIMLQKKNGIKMKAFNSADFFLTMDNTNDFKKLFSININSSCNKIYRKTLLRNIEFPMLKRGEDAIFVLETIINAKTVAFLSDTFYYYFDNFDSVTNEELTVNAVQDYIQVNQRKKMLFKSSTSFKNKDFENILENEFVLVFLRYTRRIMRINDKQEKELCWNLWLTSNKSDFLKKSYLSPVLNVRNIYAIYFSGMILSGNFLKPLLKRLRNLSFFLKEFLHN